MIDNPFREKLARLTNLICKPYLFFGLTPNQLTIIGFLIAALSAMAVLGLHPGWAVVLWWISRYFDGTDGILARATNRSTEFGAYLDIVLDMASYSLMVVALSLVWPKYELAWNFVLFFYVLCIASALAYGNLQRISGSTPPDNRGLRLASGLAEGGETGIFYSIILLFPKSLPIALFCWLGILAFTVVSRSVLAYRELNF